MANLLALVCDFYCNFVTFPFGIIGQVWFLFVSNSDPCCLSCVVLALAEKGPFLFLTYVDGDFCVRLSASLLFHRYTGSGSGHPRVNSSPRSTRPLANSPRLTRPVPVCMGDVPYIDRLACSKNFGN